LLYCIHDHNTPHGAWNGMFNSSQLRGGMRCKIPEHYSENVFTVTHHHHHQGFYCGGGAWERPAAGRVARSSGPAPALAPFPVPGRSSLWTASCCWGGGWCCCGAETDAARSTATCNRRPPSSKSASTSGLSCPVLPRRLWRVEIECCLLVLNLVSSTPPCIRQPRIRVLGVCDFV